MTITVRGIVEEPTLGMRLLAGSAGADRAVQWAATCEMDNPWEWLDAGDLLLVNGHGIPAQADAQVAFVESLASAGIAALAVAEHAYAPSFSDDMLESAERLNFPVLSINYEVAFVNISKYVARANSSNDQRNLRLVSRIYDRVKHSSSANRPFNSTLITLGELVGARLSVTTPMGVALLHTPDLSADLQAELRAAELRLRGHRLPATIRLTGDTPGSLAMPIPVGRPALLVVQPDGGVNDGAVLTHVALLVALELEREGTRHALMASIGSDLMRRLVYRLIDTAVAAQVVRSLGFEPDGELVVTASLAGAEIHLVQALVDHRTPHLSCQDQGHGLVLLHHSDASMQLIEEVSVDHAIGLSAVFIGLRRIPDAADEAAFALTNRITAGVTMYGCPGGNFNPRTLGEAIRLVDNVLGPLFAQDEQTGADWVLTLRTFLECNRSWKRASENLYLHKQSLVYRIRRIEEMLGRSLNNMDDLAEIWLALKASESLRRRAPGQDDEI